MYNFVANWQTKLIVLNLSETVNDNTSSDVEESTVKIATTLTFVAFLLIFLYYY